ncbi:hypothetical protein ACIGD1_34615 [Streptomyces sp. NPDC085612]|uniref:hypothetical protein n=1 Tax=Streptomyces sp. NPDC085612 TaxID=3365732 RepID=UPI0037D6FF35
MWIAGVALAGVLALSGYALLGGDGDADTPAKSGASPSASGTPSPEATYAAPADWTEPERWTALPRGERRDDQGSTVGFPQTTEGAAAMMAAANNSSVEGSKSSVSEQMRVYRSYLGKADQSAKNAEAIELNAKNTDKTLATEMGVAPGQPLPPGAYVRNTVVGYKVIKASSGEVSMWLLSRVVQKNGETAKESGSYTRNLVAAQWEGGDWKLTSAATVRAQQDAKASEKPAMVAPGDAAFNAAGWTAIREAS